MDAAREPRGHGIDEHVIVFTVERPQGERREVIIPPVPADKRVVVSADFFD